MVVVGSCGGAGEENGWLASGNFCAAGVHGRAGTSGRGPCRGMLGARGWFLNGLSGLAAGTKIKLELRYLLWPLQEMPQKSPF